jgi:hypothetical protein
MKINGYVENLCNNVTTVYQQQTSISAQHNSFRKVFLLNKRYMVAIVAIVLFLTAFLNMAISPALSASFDPNIKEAHHNGSLNWSGYAVTGSVTSVTGSWTVPTVTPTRGGYSYVALWTGIDGYSSNTVEQAGVMAVSNGKTVSYSAWYEFYPAASQTIQSITVNPGDSVTVTVSYSGNNLFTISVTDISSKTGVTQTYNTQGTVAGAARSSAEWIVERPSIGGSITKLANFGTATFSGCAPTGISLSSPISITMVNNKGQTLAKPGTLTTAADGSYGFSVQYFKSN